MNMKKLLHRSAVLGTLAALALAPIPARAAEPIPKSSSSKTDPMPPIPAPPLKGAAPSVKPPAAIKQNLFREQAGKQLPMYAPPSVAPPTAISDTRPPEVPQAVKLPGSETAPSIPLPGPSLKRKPPSAEPPEEMKQELFRKQLGGKAPAYIAPSLTGTPAVTHTLTRTETPTVITETTNPMGAPTVLTRTATPTETSKAIPAEIPNPNEPPNQPELPGDTQGSEPAGPPPGVAEKIKPTVKLPSSSLTPKLKKDE